MAKRIEEDFLGKVDVPADAYYGAFTVRAMNTFKISRSNVHPELYRAVIMIKKAAALTNGELGVIDKKVSDAIVKACDESLAGKFSDQFILDAFQAGAGTPLHMNVNEVIANRANELLGGKKGEYKFVHPNNHVNAGQSSNDVTPTAVRIAALLLMHPLLKEIELLEKTLTKKSSAYAKVIKVGRTHLQDAVPISYGQVFDAYAIAVKKDHETILESFESLRELGIGGTAVGTGITAHPKFKEKIVQQLSKVTHLELSLAESSVETTHNMNLFSTSSSALRNYAATLNRIANDLRLLVSGPKTGIAEVILPEIEPGSSIMPGKINPSVPEAVNMVAFQIMANDYAILLAANSGQLELNFMTPLIAHNLLNGMEMLTNCTRIFREKCIDGLRIDEKKVNEHFNNSFVYATALNPYLGYSTVSKLVTEAYKKGKSLRTLILEKKLLGEKELNKIIATATGPSEVDRGLLKKVKK
ncbi:MAG: aspartate ammonia-lyase [Candidatus Micrarchaeota archaeon]|nr:aspartate ammonia-lyase [Candidatus Micrarchaeota archaeon]